MAHGVESQHTIDQNILMIHTNVPPPNHDEELPTKQIICSPGICDVNVNRPSVAYVCTNVVRL